MEDTHAAGRVSPVGSIVSAVDVECSLEDNEDEFDEYSHPGACLELQAKMLVRHKDKTASAVQSITADGASIAVGGTFLLIECLLCTVLLNATQAVKFPTTCLVYTRDRNDAAMSTRQFKANVLTAFLIDLTSLYPVKSGKYVIVYNASNTQCIDIEYPLGSSLMEAIHAHCCHDKDIDFVQRELTERASEELSRRINSSAFDCFANTSFTELCDIVSTKRRRGGGKK